MESLECIDKNAHGFLNKQMRQSKAGTGIFLLLGLSHWTCVQVYGSFVMIVISALCACFS